MSGDDDESSNSQSEENVALSQEDEKENSENEEAEQEEVPEYEKKRQKMIEENKRRMEAMGLHKMATSFMGSVEKKKKMNSDKKRSNKKKKIADEDDEYSPNQDDDDDDSMSSSSQEDEKDETYSASGKKKAKSKSSTPMKRGPTKKKLKFDSDYVDDDESLMQAIALSLGFADNKSGSTQSPGSNLKNKASPKTTPGKCNIDKSSEDVGIHEDSEKRKKKKTFTSRVQMSEDEMLVHFLQFDETDKGYITMRDIQRLATEHDFTWEEEELADMMSCFGSGEDGKVNFDDFRKIVVRCKMLKSSNDDTAG